MSNGPSEFEEPSIRFTDNRKVDRDTADGVGTPSAGPDGPADPFDPAVEGAQVPMVEASLLDERTADLQRLQAEYANYRKRAERDRLAAGDVATGRTLAELLPVVDDLDRAKAFGDLNGPLKSVADKLDAVFGKLGMVAFGEVGDPFDPAIHEAVLHDENDQVSEPTCTTVMARGYRHGERLLRPAMVGVSDPVLGQVPASPIIDAEGEAEAVSTRSPRRPTTPTDDDREG